MKSIKKLAVALVVMTATIGMMGCKTSAAKKELCCIQISGNYKDIYYVGEEFDSTGMIVKAHYKDGVLKEVNDYTLTGFDSSQPGDGKIVTVSYKTVSNYITVKIIEEIIEEHVHTFSTNWTYNETHHWHSATCEHSEKESDRDTHSFGEFSSNNDATTEADGTKSQSCKVCGYINTVTDEGSKKTTTSETIPEGFVKISGIEIKGTETWTPESFIFLSERQLSIPTLIVCDHEVTRNEYKSVMGTDRSTADAYDKDGNKLTGDDVLNNPVNYANWYAAITYCNKLSLKEKLTPCYSVEGITDWETLAYSSIPTSTNTTWNAATCDFKANGYRLPTEAEWEWLARGGENFNYSGSNTAKEVAWYEDNAKNTGTHEVKTKKKNGYDLYDMSGNVWEWCWDWGGVVSSTTEATGPSSGSNRVTRGGSWKNSLGYCGVDFRTYLIPYSRNENYGIRVVRTAQ